MKTFAVRLEDGQDLKKALEKLVADNNIKSGVILSGVGSLHSAKLRMPVIKGKIKYLELKDLEINSLHGTMGSNGNHIHIVVSDLYGKVWGGHLKEAIIRTTCELVFGLMDNTEFLRKHDKKTGYDELVIKKFPTQNLVDVKLYTDGGSRGNPGVAAGAFVICKMDDNVVEKSGFYIGITTNNQAEYQALLKGLQRSAELGIRKLNVFMDSELVVKQLNGLYKIKNKNLEPLFRQVKELAERFDEISFTHVPRALNKEADNEVNRILDEKACAI